MTGGWRRPTWIAGAALPALIALAALAGCTPRLQPPGPLVQPPELSEAAFAARDGTALPLRSWLPNPYQPRAVIVALHGFNDYSNAFAPPAEYWAKQGIATYAYDQRGFGGAPHRGLWPGAEALVQDFRDIVALTRARHPGTPIYALGESMGGAVVMAAMTRGEAPRLAGSILVAPAVWGRQTMDLFKRSALWVGTYTLPWLTVTGRGLGIRATDNDEILKAMSADPLVIKETRVDAIHGVVDLMDAAFEASATFAARALILYGEKDEVIPMAPTLAALERMPDAAADWRRVAIYPEGYHMLLRDLAAETVWRDVAHWVLDPAGALPSAADKRDLGLISGRRR